MNILVKMCSDLAKPLNAGQNEQGLTNKTAQNTGEAELDSLLHKLFYYSTQLQPEKPQPTVIRKRI